MPGNEHGITHDHPGFCALCHTQIADFDGFHPNMIPKITRFRAEAVMKEFTLDDGSKMKVAMCQSCSDTFQPEHTGRLMESVIRGWHWEVKHLLPWEEEKQTTHMAQYEQRHIVHTEGWGDQEVRQITLPRQSQMKLSRDPDSKEQAKILHGNH